MAEKSRNSSIHELGAAAEEVGKGGGIIWNGNEGQLCAMVMGALGGNCSMHSKFDYQKCTRI